MPHATTHPLVPAADAARPPRRGRPVTVLDVRYRLGGPAGPDEHAAGHVPGAAYVDLDTALAGAARCRAGRHPLPDPEVFAAAMRAAGVSPGPAGGRLRRLGGPRGGPVLVAAALPRPPRRSGCSTAAGRRGCAAGGAVRDRAGAAGRGGTFTARPGSAAGARGRRACSPPPATGVLVDARDARAVPRRGGAGRPGGRPHARRGQRADRGEPPRGRHLRGPDELRALYGRGGARWRRTAAPGSPPPHPAGAGVAGVEARSTRARGASGSPTRPAGRDGPGAARSGGRCLRASTG